MHAIRRQRARESESSQGELLLYSDLKAQGARACDKADGEWALFGVQLSQTPVKRGHHAASFSSSKSSDSSSSNSRSSSSSSCSSSRSSISSSVFPPTTPFFTGLSDRPKKQSPTVGPF